MNCKYILILVILFAVVVGGAFLLSQKKEAEPGEPSEIEKPKETEDEISENDRFRNLTLEFIREVAENYFNGGPIEYPKELEIEGNWEPYIIIYWKGEVKGEGNEKDELLSRALEKATKIALRDERCKDFSEEDLGDARFLVRFLYPPNQFSFIEHNGKGKELIGDLVVVRNLSKELIRQKIAQGKEFLYRVMHEKKYGFYKKYDAPDDSFESRLHTVYSASIIYTFLYIYDLEKDEKILEHLPQWGDFLLSMQNKDKEDKRYGAFHYSYFLDKEERENRFVVGTAGLSIFTLLRLYDLSHDSKYLESAKLAGDWLTTMQKPNGAMKSYVRYSDGKWVSGVKESLLYNGQVLSSLSKLYKVSGDKKYFDAAEGIAQYFAQKYEKEKGYIKGEYREKNPISNCWVVMSLMDFYKVSQDDYYKGIIFSLAEKILENQKNNPDDLSYYGGWGGAFSSSGLGWISEVMAETYRFCQKENRGDCEKYKTAVIKAIRWLVQSTYSEENSFFLPNPERALGGVFWSGDNKYVRTDSVCHALNSYILIMNDLENGLLLSVPEKPFEEILDELKK